VQFLVFPARGAAGGMGRRGRGADPRQPRRAGRIGAGRAAGRGAGHPARRRGGARCPCATAMRLRSARSTPARCCATITPAQVPSRSDLKGRPQRTRRDELTVPKHQLNTILSTRDYRQGGAWLVALQGPARRSARTRRTRRRAARARASCSTSAARAARRQRRWRRSLSTQIRRMPRSAPGCRPQGGRPTLRSLAWGRPRRGRRGRPHLSVPRKDRLIRRKGWLFGDRTEHVALLTEGD
jgi:CRISPR system Cascade subunit CasD